MDWITLTVLILGVILFGFSKGGFGGGLGIFSVPLMAMVVPAPLAAAILLPILVVMDVMVLHQFWGKWDRRETLLLTLSGVIGVGLGVLTFGLLDENGIKIILGIICLIFCGLWLYHKFFKKEDVATDFNVVKGGFWGSIGGFASFIAHAGSPPVNIYILPRQLHKTTYQASISVAFAVINWVKVFPYIFLGSISFESFKLSLYLLPVGLLGVVLGIFAHHRLDERRYYTFTYVCLILIGLRLIQDGTSQLLGF